MRSNTQQDEERPESLPSSKPRLEPILPEPEHVPRGKRISTTLLFLLNGIASLLGYNCVLSSLDYFNFQYEGYNVYLLFTPPLFLAYTLVAIGFRAISAKYRYQTLLRFGFITCNAFLLLLLLLSIATPNGVGFGLSLVCTFGLGLGGNTYQLTFFAMINYLSESVVSKYTIGTALSGLSVTALRMIIVAIAGDNDGNIGPIIIYFTIAIIFNFFCMTQNLVFLRSREFGIKIKPNLPHYKDEEESKNSEKPESAAETDLEDSGKVSYGQLMLRTYRDIFPYPLIIFLNYIITFLVFPTLSVSKTFEGFSTVWSGLLFIFFYNLGDTVGKVVCDYRWTFNSLSVLYLFTSRAYFLVAIPLMATAVFDDDPLVNNYFYPYLVQFLLAVTNGIVTNACFIKGYEECSAQYKKYAGVLCGICLQVGILVGNFTAIAFSKLFI